MAITKNASDYYINETALSFTPNYQDLRDVVYVSIVSNAAIAVYKDGIPELGYGADAGYQRWLLTGYTTKLGTTGAYYIYARLSRSEKKGMIVFSVNEYNIDGSVTLVDADGLESTTEPSAEYWYIRIGDVTASTGGVDRQLNYDSGILGTNRGMAESNTMLEKMFKWNSTSSTFSMLAPLTNLLLAAGAVIEWGGRKIKGLAGIPADYESSQEMAESDDVLVTPKFIKSFGDHNYVSKKNDDTVEGNIIFTKDVTVRGDSSVEGNHAVEGVQTIGKEDAAGNIDVNKVVQEVKGKQILHGGFQTPNFFQQGDNIQGAQVDGEGNATFTSITAPVMQIYELSYNRKTAVQEEFIFSDGDTIETVTYILADGTEIDSTAYDGEEYSYIRLGVRKQYEGYMTTIKDEDVLYSNVNIIGESGQPATTGKCWMRVLALNNDLGVEPISSDGLFINAILYSEAQCPGNVNMAPTPHMVISRHGNANGTLHPDRQSVFIISTKAENMVQLHGISSPIIPDTGAYAIVSGKLPSTLLAKVQKAAAFISENDPVSYARYGIFENLIQLDHEGLPIKTERYRGKWSIDEAISNPYQSTDTSYDTVTHNGSLWQCQLTGTTVEPADNTAEWLKKVSKGDESTASIYELKPSPNIVYYRTEEDRLSVGRIDVVVGETNARGYFDITEQSVLNERNLSVSYSIDGTGERIFLNISPSALFELEDGSAVIATEDGYGLSLEGDDIDINAIEDNITIYLTDTLTNEDRATYVIPVVKDGSKGEDGLSPQANLLLNSGFDKPIAYDSTRPLRVWNPWKTEVAWSIEENKFQNTNAISVSHSSSGIVYDGTFDVSGTYVFSAWLYQSAEQEAKISVNISNSCDSTYEVLKGDVAYRESTEYRIHDITTTSVGTFVQVAIRFVVYSTGSFRIILRGSTIGENYFCQPKMELSSHATPYRKAESDLTGPAGEAGIAMYPLGDWMENVLYTRTDKSAPFVYYDADTSDEAEGTYYMLKAMRSVNEKPSENTDVWEPITGQRAIYAKFLMADFALFGSNRGAVFYDRYLFSQHGLNNTYFGDAGDDIFDEDGNFKEFIPKLHLDFYSGLGSMSCLCEPFTTPPIVNGKVIIDSVGGFNIKIPSLTADGNFPDIYNGYYPLLVLPTLENMEWAKNGSHITILFESGGGSYGELLNTTDAVLRKRKAQSIFLLVCMEDPTNGIVTPDYLWTGSYIFHKGRRSKHIILSQGNSVKLRASTVGDVLYWYVENEGSIKEEKVDIYSMTSGDSVEYAKELNSENCNRIQFYGADYSDEVNLRTDYHGEKTTTRGLMLYAGPEGFCPKNILYSPNGNTLYRRLHLDDADTVDGTLITDYGPILR